MSLSDEERKAEERMAQNLFTSLQRHTGRLILGVLAVTALLVVPFLAMAPTESASTEPGGPVFDARDRIDERFVGSVFFTGLIAEADGGDLLLAEPLRGLLAAEDALRADPDLGPALFSYYDVDAGVDVNGVLTIADLIDAELASSGGLANATDAQVKEVGGALIDELGADSDVLGLSQLTAQNEAGEWVVPAAFVAVLSDDTQLGFGNVSVNLGGDTASEEYSREIQAVSYTHLTLPTILLV